MNTNCYNTDCPWRSNETSNPTHCDCFACQNRTVQDFTVIATDHAEPLDVAPVVRCRECKFYNKPRLGWCNFHMDRENQDDFCSYGQRKEADHETSQHL